MAENYIFSVSVVPIWALQKQTTDEKYGHYSHLFQEIHTFSCLLVYFGIRQNQNLCSQTTIKFSFFFSQFCTQM